MQPSDYSSVILFVFLCILSNRSVCNRFVHLCFHRGNTLVSRLSKVSFLLILGHKEKTVISNFSSRVCVCFSFTFVCCCVAGKENVFVKGHSLDSDQVFPPL